MEFTPTTEAPLADPSPPPAPPPPSSAPPPLKFDLWMLAALGCLPISLIIPGQPDLPWQLRTVEFIYVSGIGLHCFLRHRKGRPLATVAYTGAWLMPAAALITALLDDAFTQLPGPNIEPFFCAGIGLSLVGLVAGFVTAKQIDAALVLASLVRRHARGEMHRMRFGSIRERLDEEITPLEAPPQFGIPRRFGVRGLLIATTWAALFMGILRAVGTTPWLYLMVIAFAAGTLAAQVLLFKGRHPIRASMWTGAFLLLAEVMAFDLWHVLNDRLRSPFEFVVEFAAQCAVAVPAGIIFGAVAGAIGGWLYFAGDEFLVWLTRGVPKIALEPIADADADVLLGWIIGPKFCQRWAGTQLTWPLDRQQLLDRFATAQGEQPPRRVFKAVDVRTGNMVGYVELGGINYRFHNAWLELPLVDTDASERGRLSVLLLRAVAKEAFTKLGLVSIMVAAQVDQDEVALCCDKAWLQDYYYRPLPTKAGAGWTAVYRPFTPLS